MHHIDYIHNLITWNILICLESWKMHKIYVVALQDLHVHKCTSCVLEMQKT
jgi:hypothetical protein